MRILYRIIVLAGLYALSAAAVYGQMPMNTPNNLEKYKNVCRENIYKLLPSMYRKAGGALEYPFISPGKGNYEDMLWDWDSWLADVAMRQILADNATPAEKKEAAKYGQGCVLNALNYAGDDGWVPIWIERNAPTREKMLETRNPWKSNMHKPTLAQHAAMITRDMGGDSEWLREDFTKLQAFVAKYWNFHRHRPTGLIYWETDEAIGVDNDPSTFYRPDGSSASIFLNALMYKELLAMAYLAECLKMDELADKYKAQALQLQVDIRLNCWDPRDRFYYSCDINLLPVRKPEITSLKPGQTFRHVGQPRDYECLIQRFSGWSGWMALWAGIATRQEAEEMVQRHFYDKEGLYCAAGMRTLSPLEKMYNVAASGNPSSWQGPVWIVANYLVFRGLDLYGFKEEARDIAEKTVLLVGKDFERFGTLHQYYLPDSGEPVANKDYHYWNLLVLNMIDWLEGKQVVTEF